MEYLYIGSNGFAQVGEPDFHMKNKAEMRVLMEYLENHHPIPEEFLSMCCYKVKWFQHDFGAYSEIVLLYNDQLLDNWQDTDNAKYERFWAWFMDVESANLESDFLCKEIESCYFQMISELNTLST